LGIFLRAFILSPAALGTVWKSLLLLNPMCLLTYVLKCEQNSSLFIFRFGLSTRINKSLL
jgi:hypothetical protein